MNDIDIQIQAQEYIYRQTLRNEKTKAGKHALEEIGRSLNAIAQRRRQYFLDYKDCNTIRFVREWYSWETKRNMETNTSEVRTENAATRGVKLFLHRVDFYGTLLARFMEYVLQPLRIHFVTKNNTNSELEAVKTEMQQLQAKCEKLLSDNSEIFLDNVNHTDAEKRFPVISVLPRLHEILCRMVVMSFQWRLHARYEQQFEEIANKRNLSESQQGLSEKRNILRGLDQQIRKIRRSQDVLEEEINERQQSISSSNFPEIYEECTDQIELVKLALEQCKSTIQSNDTTIKAVQERFGKYKIIGPKKKHKLESSILKRTKKVEELTKIKAELERLELHKAKLDEAEVAWLRGGYDSAVKIISTLKEQSLALLDNLSELEQQREKLKLSYEQSMEEVLRLSIDHEQLSHKYEYEKRLAATVMKTFWNNIDQTFPVKPNKVSASVMEADVTYCMLQPKGVAVTIYNDLTTKAEKTNKIHQDRSPRDVGRALDALFVQFGYYVIQRKNLSTQDIQQHMVGLSDQYHGYQGDHNSLFVTLVAQSNEKGQIVDEKGKMVLVKDLLDHFSQSRCPALIGKPKVFLLFLRVTAREPALSLVDRLKSNQPLHSDPTSYFEPEVINVENDFLVARIMYEDGHSQDDKPTFGGSNKAQQVEEIPWFIMDFVKTISQQAGEKDLLTILRNVKQDYLQKVATSVTSMVDSEASPLSQATTKTKLPVGHVNIFVDHALKKTLYIIPGM